MGEVSVSYSLKYSARVLTAQPADSVNSKWLVGTNALREENEVLVLQYDGDQERVVCTHSYTHQAEVWDLAPCQTSEELFLTAWSKGTYGASLWKTSSDGHSLEQQAELAGHSGIVRSVLWHPQQNDMVVTVDEGNVRRWAVSGAGVECVSTGSAGEVVQFWCGVLHPRNPSVLCTAGANSVQVWDVRASETGLKTEIANAHKMPVRSISFAPHADTRIVTAGDDCKLRFWDLRMAERGFYSLLDLGGHSHWVWRAQYNPFYDQLVASSSSDSLVNLYYTPQLAAGDSALGPGGIITGGSSGGAADNMRSGKLNSSGGPGSAVTRAGDLDGKAHTFDEHEDSVYGLAWSVTDPWLFASLSYDGRVVVNKVPKNIKYKILI